MKAFLTNELDWLKTLWATTRKDLTLKTLGGILLFFESGWYLGNIYNAVSSAYKYNRRSEQQFMEDLQGRYDVALACNGHGRNLVMFTMRF